MPAMPRGPRLVQLPAITVVGLRVTAPFRELFTAVPAAWREVFARAGELSFRLDDGFVDCSLGEEEGVYTELIGVRAPEGTRPPAGFEAVVLGAGTYAALTHPGPVAGIAGAFGELERWIAALPPAEDGRRFVHDGVKLDVGYLPDGSEAAPGGAGHVLHARVVLR